MLCSISRCLHYLDGSRDTSRYATMAARKNKREKDACLAVQFDGRRYRAIAAVFLRLGVIGFGGPLAHIGLMEDECVVRRKWLSREAFLEGLAVCNLLPGPTSTQLSMYLGYIRAGIVGGIISGSCFIAPAFVLVMILTWAYVQYGTLPAVGALFNGIGPVVVAIIVNTLYRSGTTALKTISSWCIASAVCVFVLIQLLPPSINLLIVLLASGLVGILLYRKSSSAPEKPAVPGEPAQPGQSSDIKSITIVPLLVAKTLLYYVPLDVSLLIPLALAFLKIGVLMFGGGLVVAPLLQQELVNGPHWLTTKQLLDGLALGQLTPGPVTTVATFAGYAVAGPIGGVVATIAVFLPSFVLVLGLSPVLLRIRNRPIAQGFLKGITAGALGAIAAAAIFFGRTAFVDIISVAIALISLLLLLRWNINTFFLICGAAMVGLLRTLL